MDILNIVLLIICFVLGACIAWFIAKRGNDNAPKEEPPVAEEKSAPDTSSLFDLRRELNALSEENSFLKEENNRLKNESDKRIADATEKAKQTEKSVTEKYESILTQIKEENARLDSQLKMATEGKLDDVVKSKLAKATDNDDRIKTLESELNSLQQQHNSLLKGQTPLQDELNALKSERDTLKKKVKKLSDDLDEAEEEQEELEDRLKKKNSELQLSQAELEDANKDKKRLKNELELRESELAEKIDDLKRKGSSIAFVQAILSAPEEKDQDKKLARNIDLLEAFVRGQYIECVASICNSYPQIFEQDGKSGKEAFTEQKKLTLKALDEWAAAKRKSWLDRKTTIAFVGEFSAGKTSIVNRLLSQDDPNIPLLPVSSKATTAIPTYIAGGVKENYTFVSPDGKLKKISQEDFKKVSKEVLDEIKGVSSLIKYFVMTYKNPNLDGLSILDTPGFNSNDSEDKTRTIGVINECDALFWVFDVNTGTVNRSSIELIKKELNKPLFVVINKVDTKHESEVDKVEALIRKTLSDAGLEVKKYIRFSSKAPLGDMMNPIKSIPKDNSRSQFIEEELEGLKNLTDIFIDAIKNQEREEIELNNKCDAITNQFVEGMQILHSDCEDAASIPQWTEHIFSNDRYEMDRDAGDELIELLDKIATENTNRLAELYDEANEARREAQQAYSDLIDMKVCYSNLNNCYEEFKKLSKPLK